jgi:DNA polymerase
VVILDPTQPLVTSIDQLCFWDTETKAKRHTKGTSDESVVSAGTYRYARNAYVTILTYAIGLQPVQCVAVERFDETRPLSWWDLPEDFREFYYRAKRGEAWFAAWNTQFDRLAMNQMPGCPGFEIEMTIDVMAQAVASNLPAKLDGAGLMAGLGRKQDDGKALIYLFTGADGATPQSHPVEWERFKGYAGRDTGLLRDIYCATRPLPRREWEEYWTSERINDRGMMVDVPFCERAAALAAFNEAEIAKSIIGLTGGAIRTVNQNAKIGEWLFDRLPSVEARDILVKEAGNEDEITGPEDELVPSKLSIAADRLEALMAWFEQRDAEIGLTDDEYDLMLLVEARLFGASATPKKFGKIVDMHVEERLMGQYTFNGAQQTGRFSSRGVQVHNLMRASLGAREIDIIDLISELEL